jgi:hypothetical protein
MSNHHLLPRLIGKHIPNKNQIFLKNLSNKKFTYEKISTANSNFKKKRINILLNTKKLKEELERLNKMMQNWGNVTPTTSFNFDITNTISTLYYGE